jgi:hypothetical protein
MAVKSGSAAMKIAKYRQWRRRVAVSANENSESSAAESVAKKAASVSKKSAA